MKRRDVVVPKRAAPRVQGNEPFPHIREQIYRARRPAPQRRTDVVVADPKA